MKQKLKTSLAIVLSILMIFTAFPVMAASPTATIETQNTTTLSTSPALFDIKSKSTA